MGKIIDRDFVRNLGNGIERSADSNLPGAAQTAASAAQTMQGAGQGGGILVAAAFFFACEYTANTWATKNESATSMNEAAQRIAQNWEDVEEYHGRPPNI